MKEKCPICFEEPSAEEKVQLKCECVFCESCLASTFTSQAEDVGFTSVGHFICPVNKTHEIIQKEYAARMIKTPSLQEKLGDALMRVYISGQPDVRACPGAGCKYAGILPKRRCSQDLSCEKCGFKWKDPSQYGYLDNTWHFISNIKHAVDSVLTAAYEHILTEDCPRCSIAISKSGGCYHMTCRKCRYEFCWYCKHQYHGHNDVLCGITIALRLFLLFIVLFALADISGTSRFIFLILGFCLKFLLIHIVFFNSCLLYTSPSPRDS
eukprot:TRINITY_DN5713_c0_g1_i4.p1 TRINITY_DN5713_c0_g1~~TRINITY_DN5713_c0_g1_i4.p1  ORF type:complete len:267 (-),score=27.48 TRINITY_DN5713_c0_g1_i4:39-839(-)